MYTKPQVISMFREFWSMAISEDESLATDKPAKSEAWNNYTDCLCKDNMITDKQYRNWVHPF